MCRTSACARDHLWCHQQRSLEVFRCSVTFHHASYLGHRCDRGGPSQVSRIKSWPAASIQTSGQEVDDLCTRSDELNIAGNLVHLKNTHSQYVRNLLRHRSFTKRQEVVSPLTPNRGRDTGPKWQCVHEGNRAVMFHCMWNTTERLKAGSNS